MMLRCMLTEVRWPMTRHARMADHIILLFFAMHTCVSPRVGGLQGGHGKVA